MIQTYTKTELKERGAAEWENYRARAAQDYLEEILKFSKRKQHIDDEREIVLAKLDGLKAIEYDKPNIKTSVNVDQIADRIADYEEQIEQMDAVENSIEAAIKEARKKLLAIPDEEGYILRLYYMLGYSTWQAVYAKAGCCETTGYERRKKGFLMLYDMGIPERFGVPEAV